MNKMIDVKLLFSKWKFETLCTYIFIISQITYKKSKRLVFWNKVSNKWTFKYNTKIEMSVCTLGRNENQRPKIKNEKYRNGG